MKCGCKFQVHRVTHRYAVVVEVDRGTGTWHVKKVVAVDDCGTRINPMIVEGQIRGGLYGRVRHGGNGADHLRRGRQLHRVELRRLPAADDLGDACVRARRDRDAVAAPSHRRQGRRRVRDGRVARGRLRQRRHRRARARGRAQHRHAADVGQGLGGARGGGAGRVNVLVQAGGLAEEGTPFVLATVVAVERPTSARVGDRALVTAEGELRGWVGGACTEPEVVRLALAALADGDVRRERIESRCASEGAVEVLIEPQRPALLLAVIGDSQAARALRELAAVLRWRTTTEVEGAHAVVVASMGRGDEEALEEALAVPAGYVGLVASARRAVAVAGELRQRGVDGTPWRGSAARPGSTWARRRRRRSRSRSWPLVAWRHTRGPSPAEFVAETAVDPICGMTVVIADAEYVLQHDGATYYFCCAGCRRKFESAPV